VINRTAPKPQPRTKGDVFTVDWVAELWYWITFVATGIVMLLFILVMGIGLALVCEYFHWVWWLVVPACAVEILIIGGVVRDVDLW